MQSGRAFARRVAVPRSKARNLRRRRRKETLNLGCEDVRTSMQVRLSAVTAYREWKANTTETAKPNLLKDLEGCKSIGTWQVELKFLIVPQCEPIKKQVHKSNGNKEASARELPRTFRETSAKTTGRFSDAVLRRALRRRFRLRCFRGSSAKGISSLWRYPSKARAYIEHELI